MPQPSTVAPPGARSAPSAMAPDPSSPAPAPAKVRDACDRCHAKKMRCERGTRGPHNAPNCERCHQARVQCTFSARTPYNSSRRLQNGPSRSSRHSSVARRTSTSDNQNEPVASPPRSLEDWSMHNMGLVDSLNTISATTASSQFAPPAAPADLGDAWMSTDVLGFDFTMPTLQPTANPSPASSAMTWDRNGSEQVHPIAQISGTIFQVPGPAAYEDSPSAESPSSDQPRLPSAEFYCQTFGPSQSFVQALASFGDTLSTLNTEGNSFPPPDVDDAELLLVLACYLKLLSRYDAIFSCWLPLVEPEVHEQYNQSRSSTLRDTILRVLPLNNVASVLIPTFYVAQLRLIVEISHKMHSRLSQSLGTVAEKVTGRATSPSSPISHISDTTLELVMGRERMVKAKKAKLMALIENSRARESMESHFALLEGGDGL
ncbi:hypothetical protein P280DRAFT_261193 [Massarina eburnea CBS 473.64]|uniref:Zn(2)-C6 fungal-type domain-containing protein n=1 Tax=Massarina eburnea CBS 473.64 TaxID=1395130 RepID=A0A6A6S342_9PLEO|nr:hypothetical protein P280DRAFT_261193 [Massarina eburnea CBS 473.64]